MATKTDVYSPIARVLGAAVLNSGRPQTYWATYLGMSVSSLNDRVLGHTRWTVDEALRLTDALGVPICELLTPGVHGHTARRAS